MAIFDLDAAILAAVAQLRDDAYGVAIRTRAGKLLNRREPSIGTIYLPLGRLERQGFLVARMGEPTAARGGRAKRLYALTAVGALALQRARRSTEWRVG